MVPVSANVKLPGYTRKHVLRRALSERLPPALLKARKRGFNVPMDDWFRDRGPVGLLAERLQAGALDALVDERTLRRMIRQHQEGREDHGAQLWNVLQLAEWHAQLGDTTEPS